jgi:hypothetical protein
MTRKSSHKLRTYLIVFVVTVMLFTNATQVWNTVSAQDIPTNDTDIEPPENFEIEYVNPYMTIEHRTQPDGTQLSAYNINGPSKPPEALQAQRAASIKPISGSAVWVSNVPSYDWVFGCGAVSAAIIAGFYDRGFHPNVYTGPTNGGVMPMTDTSWGTWSDGFDTYPSNPLVASQNGVDGRTTRGSIEDYWIKYNSSANDPYITNGWVQHSWGTAIGDYTKTSQSVYGNNDGSSWIYNYTSSSNALTCTEMGNQNIDDDITQGMKQFFEARGYTVTTCYNQRTDNKVSGGFSLNDFKAEIDGSHPVLINVEGHFMVGYGYDGTNILIRDTWDSDPNNTYTMPWGGKYQDMELLAVGVIHLQPVSTNYTLAVNKTGTGSGLVTSSPAGINCGSTCQSNFSDGSTVTLTATPDPGSTFGGWSGCDLASGNTCQVTMSSARTVTATFTLSAPTNYLLTVAKSGSGTGLVTSNPAGINCGSTCSTSYASGTSVTLTATPDPGSTLGGWSGCDLASGNTCQVTMSSARTVTATFTLSTPTNHLLTVSLGGNGNGLVTSNPAGINCGTTCSASFMAGINVTLTATPLSGANFSGWSGACTGTNTTCVVSMNQDQWVTATFTVPTSQIFSDVPPSYWAFDWINKLYNAGITQGCGVNPLRYCPEQVVNRAQMAIFLEKGMHGSSYTPPPVGSSTGFFDVPPSHWAAPWIKQLALDGITAGCGGGNYCPDAPVTRDQMAVFILRGIYGASYLPPSIGPGTGFYDVPTTHWAAAWIKQLAAEGITTGCGGGNYCPYNPVTRAQMAVFLVRAFIERLPPPPPPAPLQNGDFEAGQDGSWTEYSANGWNLILHASKLNVSPQGGQWAAWLGGDDNEVARLSQAVSIPTNQYYLHFYYYIGSEDACGFDYAYIKVNNVNQHTFSLCEANTTSVWVHHVADLSAYKGSNVTLLFEVTTDGSLNSNFFLDTISLTATPMAPPFNADPVQSTSDSHFPKDLLLNR